MTAGRSRLTDFKYSWERACDPATGSETARTYLNDIVGAAEMLAGNAQEMSGVQAVDDRYAAGHH